MEPSKKQDSHWHEEVDHRFAGLERWSRAFVYKIMATCLAGRQTRPALDWTQIRRVLIIKEPYRMGDLFQITPTLRALKTQFPGVSIGLAIQDRNLPVFQNNPHLHRIHLYEKKRINRNPFRVLSFIAAVRREKYDLAVTLETERVHLTNDAIALGSGAPLRLRYDSSAWDGGISNAFYNLLAPRDASARHQVERNFNVLAPFGAVLKDHSLELKIRAADMAAGRELLRQMGMREGEKITAMHPGAFKLLNRWPLEKFLALAAKFRAAGGKIVFTLGPSEAEWEGRIREAGIPVVAGAPLGVVSAVLSLSSLIICNDTGILHVAGGLGVPTIGLFGQTDPEQWKPPGDRIQAVRAADRSVASISVEEVWDAAQRASFASSFS